MKFTLSWLKDHLETTATVEEIAETLTDLGLEVEEVTNPFLKLKDFTLGRVLKAEPHPDADRLKVCEVETDQGLVGLGESVPAPSPEVTMAAIASVAPQLIGRDPRRVTQRPKEIRLDLVDRLRRPRLRFRPNPRFPRGSRHQSPSVSAPTSTMP